MNNFKIALIEKDINSLESLLDTMPNFNNIDSMREASYLIKEALKILENEKSLIHVERQQIKKNINFLNSATANSKSTFDIKS